MSMISHIYSNFSNLMAYIYPSNTQTNQEVKAFVQSKNKAPAQGDKENLTSAFFLKHKSEIDPTKEISLSQWAVTIAIEKKGFHAVLFIEGFDEKVGRIREKCHLTGLNGCIERTHPLHVLRCYNKQGYVLVTKIPEPIQMGKFRPNHKTWVRSREKVERMRDRIYYERDHREESAFCVLGKNSIFASKVVVLKTEDRELSAMQAKDPARFHRLYSLSIDYRNLVSFLREMRYATPQEPSLLSRVLPLAGPAVSRVTTVLLDKVPKFRPVVLAVPKVTAAIAISFVSFYLLKYIKVGVQAKYYQKELKLIESKEDKIKRLKFESNSCFTWAREKLVMIDVSLKKSSSESIVSIPTIEEDVENCSACMKKYRSGMAFKNTKGMPILTIINLKDSAKRWMNSLFASAFYKWSRLIKKEPFPM